MPLAKKYKFKDVEPYWQNQWSHHQVYRFDADHPGELFSIDTPPPTVSGSLHIGHLFSYTQAEMIARYKRHRGFNVFYPMGFDDNGLPTERLVEKENDIRGSQMPRSEFVDLCLKTTEKYGDEFTAFFQSLGFSIDWNLCYSTISPVSQRISQKSFLDLYQKNRVEHRQSPTIWCTQCQTSYAQAEVESKELPSTFNQIPFRNEEGDEIVIATTRPELLPACVSLFVHPSDERYRKLVGKTFTVPLFGQAVTLRTDEKADPDKGTGAVMCCTFGDKTDIEWWQKHRLDLREAIGPDGHMTDLAKDFKGLYVKKARKQILEKLKEEELLLGQEELVHPVNTHERCGTEQEFLSTPQWYIKVLDHKEQYLAAGEKIRWWPSHMGKRYQDWVTNLEWDWCISRQRFFGVPFPLWHCACGGVVVAEEHELPIDPQLSSAPRPCPDCGGTDLVGDNDVMDTWATSSVTPQVNQLWGEAERRESLSLPMSLRPQSHDIIRTWAFYTIVKATEHQQELPWTDVMVSGFVVDPAKKKISKSKTKNIETPPDIIEKFGADQIRWWALGSKLGVDFSYFRDDQGKFSKENVDGARRMINKLWNASRFIEDRTNSWDGQEGELEPIDLWIRHKCEVLVGRVTDYLDKYEFGIARGEIEKFFFQDFCDNYLEMVKTRLYEEIITDSVRAAQHTLKDVLQKILVLLAPYIPHITEQIFSELYASEGSLSLQKWPEMGQSDPEIISVGESAVAIVALIRKHKTENGLSMNSPLQSIVLQAPPADHEKISKIVDVVEKTCVVSSVKVVEGSELALKEALASGT